MCGLCGFWQGSARWDPEQGRRWVQRMAERLVHRGPDDAGAWVDAETGIALGHRRLAILDLSPAGHQPMLDASGRWVLVFNGEIYNHAELRRTLEGQGSGGWRGHSDTEVLLAAIGAWGLERTLALCVGMFAFALWDREQRQLTLVRDRLGEKPLYYGWQGDCLLFGSELKALKAHPAFQGAIDRDALAQLLRLSYVPAPRSIYQGIRKLPPGSWVRFGQNQERDPQPVSYWSARDVAEAGRRTSFAGSPGQAREQLTRLLLDAVGQQMLADVPLGAFLSGGIDSSTVVALMQDQSSRPVRTFSIGFQEPGYDEAAQARAVARHLGTEHQELYVSPDQVQAVIPDLPALYDEPFADSSQIPTALVARLARSQVTVSLSGDGGDELFGGYNRYLWAPRLWRRLRGIPAPLRRAAARALTSLAPGDWDRLGQPLLGWLPARHRQARLGDKLHKLAGTLSAAGPAGIYTQLVSQWPQPEALVRDGREPPSPLIDGGAWPELGSFEEQMMYLDQLTYLPDDILVKVDRAAMGTSLETRVPLLDHRVVEFAWRLPLDLKIRDGQGKWLLRQVLYQYVPAELVERPKMGFGVPIDSWLRGPLRDWAEALLDPARLQREGWLHPQPIQAAWREHLGGQRNLAHALWNLLMFQAWLAVA